MLRTSRDVVSCAFSWCYEERHGGSWHEVFHGSEIIQVAFHWRKLGHVVIPSAREPDICNITAARENEN